MQVIKRQYITVDKIYMINKFKIRITYLTPAPPPSIQGVCRPSCSTQKSCFLVRKQQVWNSKLRLDHETCNYFFYKQSYKNCSWPAFACAVHIFLHLNIYKNQIWYVGSFWIAISFTPLYPFLGFFYTKSVPQWP